MTQEEKNKLIAKLNQMVERSNKAIAFWTRLMEQGQYPMQDCLERIEISNKTKESCLEMIKKYDTKSQFETEELAFDAVFGRAIEKEINI